MSVLIQASGVLAIASGAGPNSPWVSGVLGLVISVFFGAMFVLEVKGSRRGRASASWGTGMRIVVALVTVTSAITGVVLIVLDLAEPLR